MAHSSSHVAQVIYVQAKQSFVHTVGDGWQQTSSPAAAALKGKLIPGMAFRPGKFALLRPGLKLALYDCLVVADADVVTVEFVIGGQIILKRGAIATIETERTITPAHGNLGGWERMFARCQRIPTRDNPLEVGPRTQIYLRG